MNRDWKGFIIAQSLDILTVAGSELAEEGVTGAKNYLAGKLKLGGVCLTSVVLKHPGHLITPWLTVKGAITGLTLAYDAPPAPPKPLDLVHYKTPKERTNEWMRAKIFKD
jgi:hypothetical protein